MRHGGKIALAAAVPLVLAWLLAGERTEVLLRNTLTLVAGALAVAVPLGTLLAVLLFRTDLPGRAGFRFVFGLLLLLPLYLVTGAWLAGFGTQGWFSQLFEADPPLVFWRGAIWVHAAVGIPWITCIVGVSLRAIDATQEQAALLERSPLGVLRAITLPQAASGIVLAAVWISALTASEMTATDLFRIRTYAEEIYTAVAGTSDATTAALQVLPGVLLTLCWVTVGVWVAARWSVPQVGRRSTRAMHRFALGGWKWPAVALVGVVLVLLAGVPLGNLVYQAGLKAEIIDGAPQRMWSLAKAATMVFQTMSMFSREYQSSLKLTLIAASGATLAGIALVWAVRDRPVAGLALAAGLAALVATPGPLIGFGLIAAFRHSPELYDSIVPPSVALFLRALPPAALVAWLAFRSLPRSMIESAALHGLGRWGQLLRVAVPSRRGPLLAAWLLAAIVAAGDLSASVLVSPPGGDTLAIRILDRLHSNADDQVAGICLFLIAVLVVLALAIRWLAFRGRRNLY